MDRCLSVEEIWHELAQQKQQKQQKAMVESGRDTRHDQQGSVKKIGQGGSNLWDKGTGAGWGGGSKSTNMPMYLCLLTTFIIIFLASNINYNPIVSSEEKKRKRAIVRA